jgi:nitrate reductase beta subunit
MALGAYEDRYVIPTAHREESQDDAYVLRGSAGFGFREGTNGVSGLNLFGGPKTKPRQPRTEPST